MSFSVLNSKLKGVLISTLKGALNFKLKGVSISKLKSVLICKLKSVLTFKLKGVLISKLKSVLTFKVKGVLIFKNGRCSGIRMFLTGVLFAPGGQSQFNWLTCDHLPSVRHQRMATGPGTCDIAPVSRWLRHIADSSDDIKLHHQWARHDAQSLCALNVLQWLGQCADTVGEANIITKVPSTKQRSHWVTWVL